MMRLSIFLLALSLPCFAMSSQPPILEDLDQLTWEHRIIVVWADGDTEQHQRALQSEGYDIDDRDIVWFILDGDDITTNYVGKLSDGLGTNIKDSYRLREGQVILIGKDGGVKDRSDTLQLNSLFDQIDLMPMRQREMLYD